MKLYYILIQYFMFRKTVSKKLIKLGIKFIIKNDNL